MSETRAIDYRPGTLSIPLLVVGVALAGCGAEDMEGTGAALEEVEHEPLSTFTPHERREVADQERLEAVVERIRELDVDERRTSIRIDHDTLTVDVHWKGEVPRAVRAAVNRPDDAVRVRFWPARYTRREMARASETLLQRSLDGGRLGELYTAAARPDGSGLDIEVSAATWAERGRGLEDALSREAGMPVSVTVGEPVELVSRINDFDPWKGGIFMKSERGAWCSTAFAVRNSGGNRLLSAGHCDWDSDEGWRQPDEWITNPGGRRQWVLKSIDSMLIDTYGSTTGYVYAGQFDQKPGQPRYRLKVAGSANAALGGLVATSGGNSGEHRGLKVDLTSISWMVHDRVVTGMRAHSRSRGRVAAAEGDSGGPVYHTRKDGRVGARGVISGGDTQVSCSRTTLKARCFHRVYFVPIREVLKRWGASIKTLK